MRGVVVGIDAACRAPLLAEIMQMVGRSARVGSSELTMRLEQPR